jgi:uncharacterized FlaG/YvyC family protein
MDIGGINRIRSIVNQFTTELRSQRSGADRDADGRQNREDPKKPTVLSAEQEQEAIKTLNQLPGFVRENLTASLVKESGKVAHVVVRNREGQVIRHIPYEQLIETFLQRKTHSEKGQLLKRSA